MNLTVRLSEADLKLSDLGSRLESILKIGFLFFLFIFIQDLTQDLLKSKTLSGNIFYLILNPVFDLSMTRVKS